uniref:PB1 domain-containing protein n=3 Tax=Anabas testudineus TaxID=64144 RepID=A0A7N6FKA3_ANATE
MCYKPLFPLCDMFMFYIFRKMSSPAKLRIILGERNLQKLILPDGIPASICELKELIKKQCGIERSFRLQYVDADFGNEFTNLDSISDVLDKSTLRVIFTQETSHLNQSPPPSSSATATSLDDSASGSSVDTDILSSPESTSSRSCWPLVFHIPRFSYETELQLYKANSAFKETGTLLNPNVKLKSAILDGLMEAIVQFKVYLSDAEVSEVAEALVKAHPCLKEPGSVSGFGGWKTSLKYKLGNYRSKQVGCPEVTVNSLKHKADDRRSPAYGIKKPKKAEVNYCPPYPTGESAESLEQIRVKLLSEVKIRNNEDKVAEMMGKTFALRRLEVVHDAPMVADFKARWPGLLSVREVNAEFKRITTVQLQSKFFHQLDALSEKLTRVFARKGGVLGKRIKTIMVPMTQVESIDISRECILRALAVYLNEDPEKLIKDYRSDDLGIEQEMAETVFGIYLIRHEGADPDDDPEDVGITLEGVKVLSGLRNIPLAIVMLFGLVYALNIDYPPDLKYTFEALQKIIMAMEGNRLSKKVQTLKTLLA